MQVVFGDETGDLGNKKYYACALIGILLIFFQVKMDDRRLHGILRRMYRNQPRHLSTQRTSSPVMVPASSRHRFRTFPYPSLALSVATRQCSTLGRQLCAQRTVGSWTASRQRIASSSALTSGERILCENTALTFSCVAGTHRCGLIAEPKDTTVVHCDSMSNCERIVAHYILFDARCAPSGAKTMS